LQFPWSNSNQSQCRMKVGIVNTFDNVGGAARAAYRLHEGIIRSGNYSSMFVQKKLTEDPNVIGPNSKLQKFKSLIYPSLSSMPLELYPKREKRTFSTGFLNSTNIQKITQDLDVLNFHWTSAGFQSIKSISQVKKPLVLTLHDSWAFTGGCHVPFDCEKFTDKCGKCIQLNSRKNTDLSSLIWEKKHKLLHNKDLVLVGDGNWVADNARRSSIFKNHRIEVIHPGLDLNIYKPINKKSSREIFGIKESEIVILFGAISPSGDYNKGFHLLIPALKNLAMTYNDTDNLKLIVFGASSPDQINIDVGIKTRYVGKLNDDISLSILYSAADLMIVPSIQESFGQTASESFACGTPVVAFKTSGLKDIIDHKLNGFLADPFDSDHLASGIKWVLSDSSRLKGLGIEARKKAVNRFGIDKYVDEYLKIYESIIK
jgi:glycosyltransferase involved in cell wall biosynthesis